MYHNDENKEACYNDLYNEYTPVRVQLQLHKFIWPVDQRGV